MWYAIWRINNSHRSDNGNVGGFITGEDEETPKAWETEEEAQEAMQDHIMKDIIEFIEL